MPKRAIISRRTPVRLIVVSQRHAKLLRQIADVRRWTLKTTAEDAIERVAREMNIATSAEETTAGTRVKGRAAA